MKYYVYHLIDPRTNSPFYVGKGRGQRMYSHLRAVLNGHNPNGNSYLANRIRKILSLGMKFGYRKIVENVSEEDAFNVEVSEIKKYGIRGKGCLCNLTEGGEGVSGLKHTPEQIEANRQRALVYFSNPDFRKKYDAGRNRVDWESVRRKQSDSLKRRFQDPNFRKTHREKMKQVHSLDEAIKSNSIRISRFYQLHPEHRNRLSCIQKKLWASGKYNGSRTKEWTFISPGGESKTFSNLSSFCREYNLTEANMRAVAAGRRKTHKGWTI